MGAYTQGNDTYACSNSGCQISCASPQFGANVCYSMQQNFLDGTSCQGGGKCSNGACRGSSVGKEISSWIESNKPLVIGLASALGGIVVLSILCCCWSRFRRRKRSKTRTAAMASRPPPPGWQGQGGGGGWQQRSSNWRPGTHQNADYIPQPYPDSRSQLNMSGARGSGGGSGGMGGWDSNGRWNPNAPAPVWQPSVRYA